MPLTDTAVRQAKAEAKDYTLADIDGLSLFVSHKGTKSWHFRFSLNGQQKRVSLGTYPELSLRDARQRRDEARSLVAQGIDPRGQHRADRKTVSVEETFRHVAEQWLELKQGRWADDSRKGSANQARRVLDNDLYPALANMKFREIHRRDLAAVVGAIERRGALHVAEKARSWLRQIFRVGIAAGLREDNPASDLDILAKEQPPTEHNPILAHDGEELPALLVRLRSYQGSEITRIAVRLMLLTAVRTIELRKAAPADFDLEKGIWTVPPGRVKQLRGKVRKDGEEVPPYIVPLSRQAIEEVRGLLQKTGKYPFAFAGRNDPTKMMSENTINQAIKRLGFDGLLTGHGLRGTFSTALHEMGYDTTLIEGQLSHADPNKTRAAYNHAAHVERRRAMMQDWADYLDRLEQSAAE
ncbi:TPA: integrase arm-type DNA-binding domain-containing protein [Pseudomonas aeruginosa]|uniref:tyrosine-type recombinase/integrase n=1 Tax=Pseudomonas TaxID=286 RepID=UPI000EB26361|nr:integrase arm-type DNA-binding domain-containing protein [Pseudomonas aeruginosa]RTB30392.1 DUF4102 domain-containing protein [Pseudomonas aeruginosa]HCF2062506.1 integrase arm-type DNA-binding domain-containing protein [Pseudomonas aeruginosa]HCF2709061.1 integrase arm-type DNA-binding domain-containing protein [Pseudomonas aeruginosa]